MIFKSLKIASPNPKFLKTSKIHPKDKKKLHSTLKQENGTALEGAADPEVSATAAAAVDEEADAEWGPSSPA